MAFFDKLLVKYALMAADVTGFAMHKFMTLHHRATMLLLRDGWNESAYNDLEETRKMAEEENHWFEELWSLLTEEKCLIENHNDPDLFYAANLRMKELHKVFDMPDDVFKPAFEQTYLNGKIRKVHKLTLVYPSGSLHKIPVESLIAEDGTSATVSDFYADFTRISHARTLICTDDSVLNSIGLFGGLDYGEDNGKESATRGYAIGTDKRSPTPLASWGKLKQTLPEVRNISFLWQAAKGQKTEIHTGLDGTADKFEELAENGCSVLHLATHGFFETTSSKVNIPGLKGAHRPMDLTGIVMSNGNEGWLHGNNMHHEGILTATDIAKMDLSHTKLVVLSACYTGEGIIRSDGVFGLQRAFKKAGAGSIIMSLWSESDEVGPHFMSAFYSHLLSDGIDKRKAFSMAKAEIRRLYPHPMFWANFIMVD